VTPSTSGDSGSGTGSMGMSLEMTSRKSSMTSEEIEAESVGHELARKVGHGQAREDSGDTIRAVAGMTPHSAVVEV
jgi:hypothetical protein